MKYSVAVLSFVIYKISDVMKCLLAVICDCTAWQNNSQPHQPGLCTSTSPAAISQAGFSSNYSEGIHPGLSGNIYSSVSNEVFLFILCIVR